MFISPCQAQWGRALIIVDINFVEKLWALNLLTINCKITPFNLNDFTSKEMKMWSERSYENWKRVVVAYLTALFLNELGQTEKFYEKLNQEIWKSGQVASRILPEHNPRDT